MLVRAKGIVRQQLINRRKKKTLVDGEAPASWYDDAYEDLEEYHVHYSSSAYLPVWESIANRVASGTKILEIGCGSGQLAHLLLDKGILGAYVGFDFSSIAIQLARRNLPAERFEVADAKTTELFSSADYDTVICTEVLEHIVDDILVLERIPSGKRVVATVPDFDWDSHVRFFADANEVRTRYGDLFKMLEVSESFHANDPHRHRGTLFVMCGVRA